jgi:hypothetical protein
MMKRIWYPGTEPEFFSLMKIEYETTVYEN